MKKYTGKGIYGAVAMGKIAIFHKEKTDVQPGLAAETSVEKARLAEALTEAGKQLREVYDRALREVGEADARIFEVHRMLLEDVDYVGLIENTIESQRVNAEYAVTAAADRYAEMFAAMEDADMRARAADVRDISDRLIANLRGEGIRRQESVEKVILCAADLSPSETISLDRENILALVTAHGSVNSHSAILARGMQIPAVVGVGEDFLAEVAEGSRAIVDGYEGEILVDPDSEICNTYADRQRAAGERKRLLQQLRGKENITVDGREVRVLANIGDIRDIVAALQNDAGGIGLFRSESLYLESRDYPAEERQFAVYKQALESMGGRKVIIRTLDIGADKQADYFGLKKEENPALG